MLQLLSLGCTSADSAHVAGADWGLSQELHSVPWQPSLRITWNAQCVSSEKQSVVKVESKSQEHRVCALEIMIPVPLTPIQ